jgi:hypothetical protein
VLEQTACPDLTSRDERISPMEFDAHAGGHNTARYVHYMDGHSGH